MVDHALMGTPLEEFNDLDEEDHEPLPDPAVLI
jgi:hypothetical protein